MPMFALTITYWLHLLATIVWLGGLVSLPLVTWPEARRMLGADSSEFHDLFDKLERRFRPLANVSLLVLIATGIVQMGGDSHYEGFLAIGSAWTVGLLVKHILVGGMIVVGVIIQWVIHPALERERLLARQSGEAQTMILHNRLRNLAIIDLALGVLVLLVTAFITAL